MFGGGTRRSFALARRRALDPAAPSKGEGLSSSDIAAAIIRMIRDGVLAHRKGGGIFRRTTPHKVFALRPDPRSAERALKYPAQLCVVCRVLGDDAAAAVHQNPVLIESRTRQQYQSGA